MAIINIPDQHRTITDVEAILEYLSDVGIDYEIWKPSHPIPADAGADEILSAYSREIERLKSVGGYVTADVIDVSPATPGLDEMLDRFKSEHIHDDDEVRFIIEGRGIFHIHPEGGEVFSIEVAPGDLICVPSGTRHWFDLCSERRIRAIRLFKDPAGWVPRYTGSGIEEKYHAGARTSS